MTIQPLEAENIGDVLEVNGFAVNGPNLVSKALVWARENGTDVPPLHIILDKQYPAGSGIGAGSGNAAALIMWLKENYGLKYDGAAISRLGADVSFLAMDADAALAEGIGEKLTALSDIKGLSWVLAFPDWKSPTKEAYEKLDSYREACLAGHRVKDPRGEALEIFNALADGEKIGLLPNDFLAPLMDERPLYKTAFAEADAAGALAWGLCGSGSALFAVCGESSIASDLEKRYDAMNWIIKTSVLE